MLNGTQTLRVFRYVGDRIIDGCRKSYRVVAATKMELDDGALPNTAPCETDNQKRDLNNRKYDIDNRKSHNVYTTHTQHRIHINLEELTTDMQDVFWRGYKDELKSIVNNNEITRINFNCLSEDMYRYQINMPIRKLGYASTFQRYNEDRGLAEFILMEKK